MTEVIFGIRKTYAVVAIFCHTAMLLFSVNSLELESIPGLIQKESDTALRKLKCLCKELLIFDQLGSLCYWLWLHKCTTLITAFNKISFLPSHILCIVVQLIFSFLPCSPSLPPLPFYGKGHLRSLQGIQCPEGSCCTCSAHGCTLHSRAQSRELSPSAALQRSLHWQLPRSWWSAGEDKSERHHGHTDVHCCTKPLKNPYKVSVAKGCSDLSITG